MRGSDLKDDKAKRAQAQLKNSLKQLRKLGLYNPKNARKAPTKYSKSLIKRYSDVLAGKSEVVHVPTSVAPKLKGEFRVKRSKKGSVAIVPKAAGTKAKFSKKQNTIVRSVGSYEFRPYADRMVLMRGELPKMKRGERIAVRIGNTFRIFGSIEELQRELATYDPSSTTLWQYPYIATRRK